MRRLVIMLAIACLGAAALPGSGAGATVFPLRIDLLSPTGPLTLELEILAGECQPNTFEVDEVFLADILPIEEIEPISVTEDPTDPNIATMVLPDGTAGGITVVARCQGAEEPIVVTETQGIGAIEVTKVVEGTAPPGTTFTVHLDCDGVLLEASFGDDASVETLPEDFSADLTYGETGGVEFMYTDHPVSCTITEPQNGGATAVTIDPGVVDVIRPALQFATVTNTFAAAPIVIEPTFTG